MRSHLRSKLASFLAMISVLMIECVCASAQTVTTAAGGYVGDGGSATNAAFNLPYSIVQDSLGNFYISDFGANRIRKVTPLGNISTFAGNGISGFNGDGIPASAALLSYPNGIVLDSAGNLIFADNNRVRKINLATNIITTIAGTGERGYSGDGGPATHATFRQPYDLSFDSTGNLYVSDISNFVIRKIDTNGIITTYAGNGVEGFGGDGGLATKASLDFPRGVAVDPQGNLYIADTQNHRVRRVSKTPIGIIINTFAGNGAKGFSGDGGPATSAAIGNPVGLTFQDGTLYISNAGRSRTRTVPLSTGVIETYVGSFSGYDGDNNPLLSSEFSAPRSQLFDSSGSFLITDSFNGRLRKAVNGVMQSIAGGFIGDGKPATAAALVFPVAIGIDKSGNYYIADGNGNRVRKVSGGKISTLAGTGVTGYSGDGGPAASAQLSFPDGVAADSNGNVFIADSFNNVIRKVDASLNISTFATDPNFSSLGGLASDSSNNLYVADQGTCVVWKITPEGVVSLFAGTEFVCGYNGDNISATAAQLNQPFAVAVDTNGNVLIADYNNNRVRRVNRNGFITSIAGDGTCGFTGDGGPAKSAEVCLPIGVAVTGGGTIYIADEQNERIRKITAGTINTYAGTGTTGFNGDGLPALSTNFDDPYAIAVDSLGAVYLVDDTEHRVRRIH